MQMKILLLEKYIIAGKIYNQYALNFIERSYQQMTDLKPLDIIKTIKERYIKVSQDIIEKNEKDENITIDNFDSTNPKLIKLKNENEITLKRCLIDEIGFSNFKANGFEPKYNIFKKDNKLIVRVEAPGNCDLKQKTEIQGEYNIIKLFGEKRKDKEPEKIEDNIYNLREIGKFNLEIPLKFSDFRLSTNDPDSKYIKGVYNLEYQLEIKKEGDDGLLIKIDDM